MLATTALATSTVAPAAFADTEVAQQTTASFETYYKYTTNSASFAMLNTKPAIIEQTAAGYNVTVQVSGYSIFNKFEIDGQQGITGTSFEEDGVDRQGKPTKITYTNVHFTFDTIDDVKKATVAYTAGTYNMSHDFEVDFTPGEHDPSLIKPETYYKGEINSPHFSSITGKHATVSYANKAYTVTLHVKGYNIFTHFTIDGQAGVAGEAYTEHDATYTPVTFTFEDIETVKEAVIAYQVGERDMRHTFELDFTPGEYSGAIEQPIESYYNYTTNSSHFSSITGKPAKISTKDGVSTVTLAVSNYDLFTQFDIDGQAGRVVGTFEEQGTDRQGKPTTITYTNVQFTFEDIQAVKDAIVAYPVGERTMQHQFKLDFTPGEYKAHEIAFDTYYKGEVNTKAFEAVNGKPAIVHVNEDKSYDVTLQVANFELFNTFTIDGQTGTTGESYTEKGIDRNGNEADIVYTYVTFRFDELHSAKKAELGYQAGQTAMTHAYDVDFTPGEYTYTPPVEATYDGEGTKRSYTLSGDTAARFQTMIGNSYTEQTDDGYNVFIELKSADVLSTFTINGVTPTTVKDEPASNTRVVSIAVKDLTTPLAIEAAVKYAPSNVSTFSMAFAAEEQDADNTVVHEWANGFYDAAIAFEKDTGNSFIQQQTQLFVINGVTYMQLAIKNTGIDYVNVNGQKQTAVTTIAANTATNEPSYDVYIVKVEDVTKPLSIDLSVHIPNVYEHVYEGLVLHINDVEMSTATAFTHAQNVVKKVAAARNEPTPVWLLTNAQDAPVTSAVIEQTTEQAVQFTIVPTNDRLVKITAKDGKTIFYEKPMRQGSAEQAITFTAPSIEDVAFVYVDAAGKEKTAAVTAAVEVDAAIILETPPAVEVVEPPTTEEDDKEVEPAPITPPATGGNTTPPSSGNGTVATSENGTYAASISFGATGDSFLRPTATVIKDGDTYKVRVVVQGANAIQSFSINGSTQTAPGVYEFTTASLTGITASMHVVVPEADYEHTYDNIAVTLSLGAKVNDTVTFPAPPTTDGSAIIPPAFGGGSTPAPTPSTPDETEQPEESDEPTKEETETPTPPENCNEEAETPAPLPFTDVQGEYVSYVQALYTARITTGTTATTFEPHAKMTRAQFAVMVARALDVSTTNAPTFTDVQGKWYATSIQALADIGIVTGKTATTFEPGATLTRQQAAVMLHRLLAYKGYQSTVTTPTFTDTAAISDYAKPAFATLQQLRILTGDNGYAYPHAQLTRGQMAKLLQLTLQIAHDL